MTEKICVPIRSSGRLVVKTITIERQGSRIFFLDAPFSFKDEIKTMEDAKWHGFDEKNPRKAWSVADSTRNRFTLAYWSWQTMPLEAREKHPELNPYYIYERPILDLQFFRPLYDHQKAMVRAHMTRKRDIYGCEMGTGKSLAAIECAERVIEAARCAYDFLNAFEDEQLVWYVGPKAGMKAMPLELKKWRSKISMNMFTYDQFANLVKHRFNVEDHAPPLFLILDESQKIKNPQAQRSAAAMIMREAMMDHWGDAAHILEMTGTPAPKTPVDWWHQCEVACPGFIREGNIFKFQARLCLMEERQGISGVYRHIVTWLDDERKCATCGEFADHPDHAVDFSNPNFGLVHTFVPSVNEVAKLYKRMGGIVTVFFKKDCLDLPEKIYEEIKINPTPEIIRACNLIKASSSRAIEALTLMREISDGFQYTKIADGEETCPNCKGHGMIEIQIQTEEADPLKPAPVEFLTHTVPCETCGGIGKVAHLIQGVDSTSSPKDEVFTDDLDAYEDDGRYVVWGGFTGTIDRLVAMAHQQGWSTLRVDGRGFKGESAEGASLDADELLVAMDISHPDFKNLQTKHPRLCFVGHPQAGGLALTLTASCVEMFYSNSFSGEARMQAEDRCHRAGMDKNRGLVIKDLLMLPTDKHVLDNLKKKRDLQALTMGELATFMKES